MSFLTYSSTQLLFQSITNKYSYILQAIKNVWNLW